VFIGDLRSEVAHTHSALPAGASAAFTLAWVDVDDPTTVLDPDSLLPVSLAAGAPSALPASAASTRPYRLAMTGRAYAALHQLAQDGRVSRAYFQKAVLNCAVFARASPEHKASVVEALQGTGLYVGMIGDGANDSLALRAAHVGISLSQVEASVSAPFSSLIPNISCIHPVLCEGRGSLATSVKLFQFMALYSTIQFANALLIVFCNSFLANNQYMYQDLFVVFFLSLVMGSTPSATRLTRKRPTANLLSLYNLLLCAGFIVVTFVPQLIVFLRVRRQVWYDTPEYPAAMSADDDPEGTNSVIPETTSVRWQVSAARLCCPCVWLTTRASLRCRCPVQVFLVAMLQYVAIATIFSVGYPWKKMTYHNCTFAQQVCVCVCARAHMHAHMHTRIV
ncbi:HAD family hydrolase, partial [archaeon]